MLTAVKTTCRRVQRGQNKVISLKLGPIETGELHFQTESKYVKLDKKSAHFSRRNVTFPNTCGYFLCQLTIGIIKIGFFLFIIHLFELFKFL